MECNLPPHPTTPEAHDAFLEATGEHLYCALAGGRGSGKTDIGATAAAINLIARYPGEKGILWVPDYPRSEEAREKVETVIPAEMRHWQAQRRIWLVRNAEGGTSKLLLRSFANGADVARSYRAAWNWIDEGFVLMGEDAYRNILAISATEGDGDLPGPHFVTSTPKGRNWGFKDFVLKPTPNHWLRSMESIENPSFSPVYWQELIDRHGYDSPFFRQEYRGLFEAFMGQAFPEFNRTQHARHLDANNWLYFGGWDFGWTAHTVFVWAQISPDEDVILRGCKTWTETTRREVLATVSKTAPACSKHLIDPSGAVGRGEVSDPGWKRDMNDRGWEVAFTRKIGETRGLNLIRQWLHQGKLLIDLSGEGAELLCEAFETGELDKNPEKDILADQHPQADILDAVRYIMVNLFGKRALTITRH